MGAKIEKRATRWKTTIKTPSLGTKRNLSPDFTKFVRNISGELVLSERQKDNDEFQASHNLMLIMTKGQ